MGSAPVSGIGFGVSPKRTCVILHSVGKVQAAKLDEVLVKVRELFN
jgi:hypothetical protein